MATASELWDVLNDVSGLLPTGHEANDVVRKILADPIEDGKFALVSTTDTMGEGFPCHSVIVFDTEAEAIEHAISLLEKYDDRIVVNGYWWLGTEQYSSAEELLEAWQDGLGLTEYFHIMPIAQKKAE